jgi:hypothetical protein
MLADVLTAARPVNLEFKREPLLYTWAWLAIIVGLLTLEWVVRRTSGLA